MRATRKTQPYRKGARVPTDALRAMVKGRTAGGANPADVSRMAQQLATAGESRGSARPPRPARPARTLAASASAPPKFPEGMSDAEKRRRKSRMRPQTRGRYGRPNVRA